MAEANPNPSDSTGTAPATPGASPSETPAVTTTAETAPAVVEPVIPEKYEFKLAEGRALDQGLIDAVSPLFKEFKLTQESASKLVEAYDKYGQAFEAKAEKDFQAFMKDTADKNIAAIKKEWGADYEANLNVAQRGIARFLGADGKKALEDSGLGNHPAFLKAFYQAGKMIQEDQPPSNVVPKANGTSKLFTKSLAGVN